MLTEPLVRLGRPLLEQSDDVATILLDVSDIEENTGKFYAVVWLVEVPVGGEPQCRPYEVWGTWQTGEGRRAKVVFEPDFRKAVAAPLMRTPGGGPWQPQGRYPVPAYFMFARQHQELVKNGGPAGLARFLELRLRRTYGRQEDAPEQSQRVAELLWEQMQHSEPQDELLLICHLGPEEAYRVIPQDAELTDVDVDLGPSLSVPGTRVVANLERIVERFWWAKQEEGAQYGSQNDGVCTFCGARGEVVSGYSKAWPWFTLTWTAPLAEDLGESELVEAVACCPRCYAALTYGGKLFARLSRNLDPVVVREIFEGHGRAAGPPIQGAAWLLPWHDDFDHRRFAHAVRRMRYFTQDNPRDLHIRDLLGFDSLLPDELNTEAYRLTAVYYTQSNADIQLHAMVNDVEPGTVKTLKNEVMVLAQEALDGEPPLGLRSLPAWLAKAYGGGSVWQSLEKVLHRQALGYAAFLRRATERMQAWVKHLPDGKAFAALTDEVRFFILFSSFLSHYHEKFGIIEGERIDMKNPAELQALLQNPETLWELKEPADVGFVAGSVVREFSRRYRAEQDKDFLKTRVMTFGSRLDPETLWKRALIPIIDLARRLDIDLGRPFLLRLGQVLRLLETYREEWTREPDAFLSGFWSGYCLTDRGFTTAPSPTDETHAEIAQ
ncbi:MAG: hypothetical protein K6U87_07375 [Firmicutes bacterium]|nr:hypothetical protein [Bacillota bacterium]